MRCMQDNDREYDRCIDNCQEDPECTADCDHDFSTRQLECPCEVGPNYLPGFRQLIFILQGKLHWWMSV